jgi:sulfite reductase alpha subunit-like flavoprotein
MILIGPGTGVAPMRAILQERKFNTDNIYENMLSNQGKTLLFFGCRNRSNDFLYKNEWEILNSDLTGKDMVLNNDILIENEIIEGIENNDILDDPDIYGYGGLETVIVAFSRDQTQKVYNYNDGNLFKIFI